MRWLLLVALVGCGSNAAGERIALDSDPPPDASVDTGAIGGAGGADSGGTGGAAGSPAPSCSIPESAITATAGLTQIVAEGGSVSATRCAGTFPGPYYPTVSQGQITGGVPYPTQWTLTNYSITTGSGGLCGVTIEFTCAGCAGGPTNCGDGFMEIGLTVAPK